MHVVATMHRSVRRAVRLVGILVMAASMFPSLPATAATRSVLGELFTSAG